MWAGKKTGVFTITGVTDCLQGAQTCWEANSSSAGQESPRTLWNPTVHHRAHNSPQSVTILSEIRTVHALPYYFFILVNSTIPSTLRFPSVIFISVFPTINISNT